MKCGSCQAPIKVDGPGSFCPVEFAKPRLVVVFCSPLCAFYGGSKHVHTFPTTLQGFVELFGVESVHEVPEAANQDGAT
jgi:hypothetical protein